MTITILTDSGEIRSGKTVLDAIRESRVFIINKQSDSTFRFIEGADFWLTAILTKEQVLALADELRELANAP